MQKASFHEKAVISVVGLIMLYFFLKVMFL